MQLYVGGIERMLYRWSGGNVMHLCDVGGMEVVYYVAIGALYTKAMCGKIMDYIECFSLARLVQMRMHLE